MKKLTARQARACEEATLPRCRCRCNGALHGAKRNKGAGATWFSRLPESDPHYVVEEIQPGVLPGQIDFFEFCEEDRE